MPVTAVHKDPKALTMTLTAEFDASPEQVWDLWADPRGEYLSLHHAEPVYRLLGTDALGGAEMPGVNRPVQYTLGYHIRTGKHDVTEYDWQQYLDFADKHFGRKGR